MRLFPSTLVRFGLPSMLVMWCSVAAAQAPAAPTSEPDPAAPAPPALPDPSAPSAPSAPPPVAPPENVNVAPPSEPPPPEEEPAPRMSEGRAIVSAWNSGFQWGLSPGVIFVEGSARFALGVRLGYGFDTDSVIIVPGVRGAFYFTDPNVYLGMPMLKLVYPIDRFAPFVEGGAGVGHVSAGDVTASSTGAALFFGGGFMIHFTRSFGLGAEANYQVVTGTPFKGFGVGPIIAIAF